MDMISRTSNAVMITFTFPRNLLDDPDGYRVFSRHDFESGAILEDARYAGLAKEIRTLVERLFASADVEDILWQISISRRVLILVLSKPPWQHDTDPAQVFQTLYCEVVGEAIFPPLDAARTA